jgi:hypothetical protein
LEKGNFGMEGTGEQRRSTMTISEEDDEEEYLNSTQNPLYECDLATLISSITGKMDNDIWINAKMSMATKYRQNYCD